jgi:hypothetical protein
MSTPVLEAPVLEQQNAQPIVEQPAKLTLVAASPAAAAPEKEFSDPRPLLPVFIAGAIALLLALAFVGSIVAGLLLRNSGVMAP